MKTNKDRAEDMALSRYTYYEKILSFIEFDSETKDGFKIAPKNGNYTISFSAGDFENFFKSYFREKTKELLFESEK